MRQSALSAKDRAADPYLFADLNPHMCSWLDGPRGKPVVKLMPSTLTESQSKDRQDLRVSNQERVKGMPEDYTRPILTTN
jgi:hypothetical protein